jgi:hypothetical protein
MRDIITVAFCAIHNCNVKPLVVLEAIAWPLTLKTIAIPRYGGTGFDHVHSDNTLRSIRLTLFNPSLPISPHPQFAGNIMVRHFTTREGEEGIEHVELLGVGGYGEVHKVLSRCCAISLNIIDEGTFREQGTPGPAEPAMNRF